MSVLRRFARRGPAIAALGVLAVIALLAVSAVGVGPVPGWWGPDYRDPLPLVDAGRPTLSLWPPSLGEHPFGQDNIGRDYFALTLRGVQQSLVIAAVVGVVGTILGTAIGACAGYFRGWIDAALMRLTDVMLTVPLLAVAAVVAVAAHGRGGVWALGVFLGLVTWAPLARLVRAETLTLRERDFVAAAQTFGSGDLRIIRTHVLPNAIGVIVVSATLAISAAILLESALSFLGFGVRPPDTSLGQLINAYRSAMTVRPWLFWWPGLFIVAIALAVNVVGDGLRDAFDPHEGERRGRRRDSRQRPAPTDVGPAAPDALILEVRNLQVDFRVDGAWRPAVRHLDLTIGRGEVVAVVGGSGAGKSTAALALLGLLPASARTTGSVRLRGRELVGAPRSSLNEVRGALVGFVFQDPLTALNPVLSVGAQVADVLGAHCGLSSGAARRQTIELFRRVRLTAPERTFDAFAHQLSGGQRQRVLLARAMACDPVLLIADEPTSALDVVVQAEILDLLRALGPESGAAVLLITHDLGIVADLADKVVVMADGAVVEEGSVHQIFASPAHADTAELLAAVPRLPARAPGPGPTRVRGRSGPSGGSAAPPAQPRPLPTLTVRNLVIDYPARRGAPALRAVDDVSFAIAPGEVLGLVGETGSGKSTIGRALVGLLPVSAGSISIRGVDVGSAQRGRRAAGRESSIVFQDPDSALNPRMTIGESVGEPLRLHAGLRGATLDRKVQQLLGDVQLSRTASLRYPHELSGGERQRVGLARALALGPALVVADEPTSALDVVVQAQVLDLVQELQRERGFACLLISHDLAVVGLVAHRVAVLRGGRILELGSRDEVLSDPRDTYTQRLLSCVPVPEPDAQAANRRSRSEGLDRA